MLSTISLIVLFYFSSTYHSLDTGSPVHKFHVSKCLVEYNEEAEALQMSMHIFLDDLEEALRQEGHDDLFLCTGKEAEGAEDHLRNYLKQQFQLEVNNEKREYAFLGKEISDDLAAVWCYLEIKQIKGFKNLKIKYSLLTEVFDDQKNIANVLVSGKNKGFLLFEKGRVEESVQL
ncbi:MAG: hypothetical protein GY705_03570 [Bacteroidetes bacterium]|nr:hypothetical protein [Bacteroidota bacterium]